MKHLKTFKQLNEGRVAYALHPAQIAACEEFFKKHPSMLEWMQSFVKTGDAMRDYKKFLTEKNRLEDLAQKDDSKKEELEHLGFTAETVSSSAFGTKTFFKIDFPPKVMFAELFQYLHDGGINEWLDQNARIKKADVDSLMKETDAEDFIIAFGEIYGSAADIWMSKDQFMKLHKMFKSGKYDFMTLGGESEDGADDTAVTKAKAKGWKVFADEQNGDSYDCILYKNK